MFIILKIFTRAAPRTPQGMDGTLTLIFAKLETTWNIKTIVHNCPKQSIVVCSSRKHTRKCQIIAWFCHLHISRNSRLKLVWCLNSATAVGVASARSARTPFFVVMIQGDLTRSTKTKLALIMVAAAAFAKRAKCRRLKGYAMNRS